MKKYEKEVCPFCDKDVEVDRIEKINKKDTIAIYICECGWDHIK